MELSLRDLGHAAAVGVGATAVMDLGGEALRRTCGIQPLDYALLGRWIGHMPRGQFAHASIAAAATIPHEREIGWAAHYSIGTTFAIALATARPGWLARPTLGPALAAGVATTAAPWLLMQPAFGLGLAAARTPDPRLTRLRSLRTHATFGVGLWLAGRLVRSLTH